MADKLCRPLLDTRAKEYLGRGQLAIGDNELEYGRPLAGGFVMAT
jgi:hypothetical protein